jgi:hypothetical protein
LTVYPSIDLILCSLIEYQFGQFGQTNETIFGTFNARKLDESAAIINQSLATDNPAAPGYIYATLTAYNATGIGNNTDNPGTANSQSPSGDSGDSPNTGLAMSVNITLPCFELVTIHFQDHSICHHRMRFCFVLCRDYLGCM